MKNGFFTSESVTDGHPDKICDQISDAILDEALRQDPDAHMAVEATIKDDVIFLYGEAGTTAGIDYEGIAMQVLKDIGYQEEYHVIQHIGQQSQEINAAVDRDDISAGDQGMMFGYACDETEALMPAPVYYAHRLSERLMEYRRQDNRIRPDGKTQVTVEYRDGKVFRIDTVVISSSHTEELGQDELKQLMMNEVIARVLPGELLDDKTRYLINPSGSFTICGSWGDSGTTGRKIIVDSYGGMGRVGGGCFSSKDPSKVDRSGAYYARYVAKNIVANGLAGRCEVQVSYAIGVSEPVSVMVETFGTAWVSEEELMKIVRDNFDFRVGNIIRELDLKRPIYRDRCNFGHFGHEGDSWERIIVLH
ncbi:MAG: methionine adenosyltransferase [Erysipelotrichaceae bacterium]|nr:methionine adenosyltransferase [Erysipelotrichaceae bacterium]